jgi:choline dehydrogenase
MAGNPGWSFTEVLPCFRRLEDDRDFRDEWHGQHGPVPIRRASSESLNDTQRRFLEACQAAGHPFIADHNAPGAVGAGPWPTNTVAGIRQSAALTYLLPARARPNLTIQCNAMVNRVIFEGRRAVGLQLASPRETIRAERVILASGAYGSPAILLRSGLGPAEALRALDIPVLEDRPGVGRNLSDHPLVGVRLAASSPAEAGPSFQVALTCKSAPARPGHDLQVFASSRMSGDGATMFYLFASLLKPLSRGWLGLRSADPSVAPCIDPGYFSQPADLPRMILAVRLARRLAQLPPLSHLVLDEVFPGASIGDTDVDLATVIRAGVESYHHPVGTCRMGPVHETTAVVDQYGAVHSVDGLWVIDASIMPTIPAGNTHLPTLMVAERCAAWLVDS